MLIQKISRTRRNYQLVQERIEQVKKENPYWIKFFHETIEESSMRKVPVIKIVKREFKNFRLATKSLTSKDEVETAKFIGYYAQTHFNMMLQ